MIHGNCSVTAYLYVCDEKMKAELWVKKHVGKNRWMCWIIKQMFFFSPILASSPSVSPLTWLCDLLRKTSVFLSNKTLTCSGGEGWFAFIWPFKVFCTLTICEAPLELSEILSFLHLCFGQKHVLFLHEGIPSRRDPKHHIFSALHKESFIIFVFCLALTRVFKLARRRVMKSLLGREVFPWDVKGREDKKKGKELR